MVKCLRDAPPLTSEKVATQKPKLPNDIIMNIIKLATNQRSHEEKEIHKKKFQNSLGHFKQNWNTERNSQYENIYTYHELYEDQEVYVKDLRIQHYVPELAEYINNLIENYA